ncbi:virulence associated secretory protein [Salmonella enterica subsp. enterica]|uniref:Virulence associated secretory protein n=1 Tax=Salmonella enterica I TaxID=59201 RepID=A0A3S4FJF8_SALET|nr:virulence associated secretory protein [Salmonella enterica subsp. enterica]
MVLSVLFYFKFREAKRSAAKPKTSKGEQPLSIEEKEGSSLGLIGDLDKVSTETVPLILLVPKSRREDLEKLNLRSVYVVSSLLIMACACRKYCYAMARAWTITASYC